MTSTKPYHLQKIKPSQLSVADKRLYVLLGVPSPFRIVHNEATVVQQMSEEHLSDYITIELRHPDGKQKPLVLAPSTAWNVSTRSHYEGIVTLDEKKVDDVWIKDHPKLTCHVRFDGKDIEGSPCQLVFDTGQSMRVRAALTAVLGAQPIWPRSGWRSTASLASPSRSSAGATLRPSFELRLS